jgi:hypothetical protein
LWKNVPAASQFHRHQQQQQTLKLEQFFAAAAASVSPTLLPVKKEEPVRIECDFCHTNYQKSSCQFYRPFEPDSFAVKSYRNGKLVICECCDYTDDEENEDDNAAAESDGNNSKDEKRIKLNDSELTIEEEVMEEVTATTSASSTSAVKVQAGWYGKGYRKIQKYKKKRGGGHQQ